MDANMEKLRKRLVRAFQFGPLVQFFCKPTSAKLGEKVQIVAVFFAQPNEPLSGLKPLVKCKELDTVEQKLSLRQPHSSKSEMRFECELDTEVLDTGSFTFLLYKKPEEKPIASTTLEIFKKREIEDFRDSIKDLLGL